MVTHNLGLGHGSLMENVEKGQVTYRPTGKLLPAFTVRIADVTGVSTRRRGFLTQTMQINGQGTVLAECEVNHGTADLILQWFDERARAARLGDRMPALDREIPQLGDQMMKLAELHRTGALTDEEFSAAKQRLLGS